MEKKHIILAAIIVILLVVLLFPGGSTGPRECGTDITCITEVVRTCSPATFTSIAANVTTLSEIHGIKGDKCEVSLTNTGAPEGSPLTDTTMTCLFPLGAEDVMALNYTEACTGTMADALSQMGQQMVSEAKSYRTYGTSCTTTTMISDQLITYNVIGPETRDERDMCHSLIKLGVPSMGTLTLDYYFNRTQDGLQPSFELSGSLKTIRQHCDMVNQTFIEQNFAGMVAPAENQTLEDVFTCHLHYELLPTGPPVMTIDVFVQDNGRLSALIKTERDNIYTYEFAE